MNEGDKLLSWRCKPGKNLIEINRGLNEGKVYSKKKIFQSEKTKKKYSLL